MRKRKDRIITHLRNYKSLSKISDEHYRYPLEVTAYGIAEATGISKNDIRGLLKDLEIKGYVECRAYSYIRGSRRRSHAYLLTCEGIIYSEQLESHDLFRMDQAFSSQEA